jgi:hypothetical protein
VNTLEKEKAVLEEKYSTLKGKFGDLEGKYVTEVKELTR